MRDEFGVNSEELRANELPGYMALVEAVRNNTLDVSKIKSAVATMKDGVEIELSEIKDTPQTWLSLLSFFIPFLGIVRKWYQDQRTMYLQARLKNLTLIHNIFLNSEKVQKELDRQVANLKKAQEEADERR